MEVFSGVETKALGFSSVCVLHARPGVWPHPLCLPQEAASEGLIICPWRRGAPGLQVGLSGGQGPSHRPVGSIVAERGWLQAVPLFLRHPVLGVAGAIFQRSHDYDVSGCQGWVLWEEVEGSEQEAHGVPGRGCVGDVLCVGDVQEAHRDPGHQVLWDRGAGLAEEAQRGRGGRHPSPRLKEGANLVNPELPSPPSKLVLALLGLGRDPGTRQGSWDRTGILGPNRYLGTGRGSWDLAGILGLDRDPRAWQGSWDWTGILGLGRDPGTGQGSGLRVGLEKGRAGTSSSMFSLL